MTKGQRATYEPVPGVLVEEAHGDVKGRASPTLERIGVLERVARLLGNVGHVDRPEPGRKQRLVGVTPGRVHDQAAGVSPDGLGEGLGALVDDNVAPAGEAGLAGVDLLLLVVGRDNFGQ